jgi:hypothetical protein
MPDPAYAPDAYPPGLLNANKIADPEHDWGYTSRGIDPDYLGTARDARCMLEAVKIGRAICRHPVFAPFVAPELLPRQPVGRCRFRRRRQGRQRAAGGRRVDHPRGPLLYHQRHNHHAG